jgi:8-oxo-dGTP pyrophosphatase MutT (NUDIX family)
MHQPNPDGATPAATLVLARDAVDGLEVLVIERAGSMGFAGGAIAFPGGKVDVADRPRLPECLGFGVLDEADALARITAARETFEETGILVSSGPAVAADTRRELRPKSDAHAIAFADLLAHIGHRIEAEEIVPFARWLPPLGLHRRYDTRFYLARMPEGEAHLADGSEAVHARWATPARLLGEADAGAISLLFPTRCNLARLAQFESVAGLLSDATPPPFVQPAIEAGWLTIPDGLGYPYVRERLEMVRRS